MPSYDIDRLRAEISNPAKLLFRLWELWGMGTRPEALLVEERVINDAWIYDTGNGNGIWDMLVNERYDDIAAGLVAFRQLGSPKLNLYVESIAAAFRRFGCDCFDPESIEMAHQRGEPPREVLEAAEQPYLRWIWSGAIIDAAQRYIEEHIDAYRTRQPAA